MRKKVYRIKQAVWGSDYPEILCFRTKKEQKEYYLNHEYCDMLSTIMLEEFNEYGERNFYYYGE